MQNLGKPRGLNEKAAANYIGISYQYLRQSRLQSLKYAKDGPPFCKVGRRVIYLVDDLDRWLESRRETAQ